MTSAAGVCGSLMVIVVAVALVVMRGVEDYGWWSGSVS